MSIRLGNISLVLLALLAAAAASAQSVTFGTYNPANSLDACAPVYRSTAGSAYDTSRFACLYTSSDLAGIAPGAQITDLEFYKDNSGATSTGATGVMNIYLRNTSATSYATSDTWTNLISGATLVYSNNAQTIPATTGFMSFGTFNGTAFTYMGDSLEVMIEWDISGYTSGSPTTDEFVWALEPYSGSTTNSRVIGDGDTSFVTTLDSTGLLQDHHTYQPLLRVSYSGGSPGTLLNSASSGSSALPVGAMTDLVVMDMDASSFVNDHDLTAITFRKSGTVADTEFTNITLYRDNNNDGIIDSGDTVLASGGSLSGAQVTFSISPPQTVTTTASVRILLGVDLSSSPAPGDSFSFSVNAASDVTWSGGTDITSYPVNGETFTILDPNVPSLIYYKMNEGTGTSTANDAIPGVGNNPVTLGTGSGTPTWVTPGRLGASALDFDVSGAAGLDTGYSGGLSSSESWTIETWLSLDSAAVGHAFRFEGNSFRLSLQSSGQLELLSTGGTPSTSIVVMANPPIGTWFHVAFVYDHVATTLSVYLNGSLVTVESRTAEATGNLCVGSFSTTSTTNWKGKVDEFRIWNKVRSAGEVQAGANTEMPPQNGTAIGSSSASVLLQAPGTDVVVMDMSAYTFINNHDLNSVTFTKTGSVSDADVTGMRLYLDNNDDGIVDGGDTLLGTDTLTGGQVSFSGGMLPLTLSTSGGSRLLLAADLSSGVLPGQTIQFSVDSASDISFSGGSDFSVYPVIGNDWTAQGPASTFPFHQGFETPEPYYNGTFSTASNLYPTITSVGSTPSSAAAAGTGGYQIAGTTLGSSPVSGNGLLDMEGGSNIGAVALDLLFDFTGVAASDTVELEFWWNDEGLDPDTSTVITEHFNGVFISTDGGTNWHMGAFQVPVVTGSPGTWNQEIIDLSALMSAASLTFTNQTVIRFQMAQDSTSDHLLLDDITVRVVPPSVLVTANSNADANATIGGSGAWVASFDATAFGGAQTPSSVTLNQIGTESSAELSNLTLWEDSNNDGVLSTGDSQVGSSVAMMTGDEVTFSGGFSTITAAATESYFVTADLSSGAGTLNTIQFEIELATDFVSAPDGVSGSFPVQGATVVVIPPPLSGIVTVANGNPGNTFDFASIGEIFDVLELSGLSGPLTIQVYDDGGAFVVDETYRLGVEGDTLTLLPVNGLSATNTITIAAAAGESPVISGNGTRNTYTTSTEYGTMAFRNVGNITLDGLEFTGGDLFGVMWYSNSTGSSDNITIQNCKFHGITTGAAIYIYGSSATTAPNNVLIENNLAWDVHGDGSGIGGSTTGGPAGVIGARRVGTNFVIRHNTILLNSTGSTASAFFQNGTLDPITEISYNVVYIDAGSSSYFYKFYGTTSSSTPVPPTTSNRNVVYLGSSASMFNDAAYATWAQWQTAGLDLDSVNADPLLTNINPGSEDLHLTAASPAIDLAVGSSTSTDIEGTARPLGAASDSGAYEGDFPIMSVLDGTVNIPHNGARDVGTVSAATGTTVTFTIENTGSQDLDLTGSPAVSISLGANLDAATNVSSQPAVTTISAGSSTTFDVFIQPTSTGGTFDLTLSIDNNGGFNPFVFDVTGNGTVPNSPAVANTATGSSFSGATDGPFTLAVDPGVTLANAEIELTDPETDNITVTAINPPATAPTGITAPTVPTPGHPVLLTWTGTANATNVPDDYTWQVTFEDAVNGTSKTVDVTITINNLLPAHTIANASGGDGSGANPYTTEYTETMDGTSSVDLANVTDANTGQTLSINPVAGVGNPTGGAGFSFSLAAGVLTVAPSGALTSSDVGTHTFDVDVDDGIGITTIAVSIDVAALPDITTTSPLANGEQGLAYTPVTITATGGTGALSFAVTSGALPPGMSLSSGGVLDGTPTAAGAYNFTVTATDTLNISGNQVFDITIDPPSTGSPNITTTTLPNGTEGQVYGPETIAATGGAVPYTFALTSGSLPTGLSLSTAGVVTGTPTVTGVFMFDVTVTDAAFATDTETITLQVNSSGGGGGGGGGGGSSGGGCAADASSNGLWSLLLGALALLAVATRVRALRD